MSSNSIGLSKDFTAAGLTLQIAKSETESKTSTDKTRNLMLDASRISTIKTPKFPPEKSGFSLESTGHFRTQEIHRFQDENQDLLSVIDQSDKAKERLQKTDIRSRDDLIRVIAESAYDDLNAEAGRHLSTGFLKSKPLIASLLLMNTGGLKDLVNEEETAAKELAETSDSPENDLYREVAVKAAALFSEGAPLHDEAFFVNHPKAAAYLLTRRDAVAALNQTPDRDSAGSEQKIYKEQLRFRDQVASSAYDTMLDSFLTSFAKEAVNAGPYSEDFFSEHINFAEYVAAGEFLDNIPKPSEYLKKNPGYVLENVATNDRFNFPTVVQDILSRQASTLMGPGSALTDNVLGSNLGLARLITRNKGLRDALRNDESSHTLNQLLRSEAAGKISQDTLQSLKSRFQATFEGPKNSVSLLA